VISSDLFQTTGNRREIPGHAFSRPNFKYALASCVAICDRLRKILLTTRLKCPIRLTRAFYRRAGIIRQVRRGLAFRFSMSGANGRKSFSVFRGKKNTNEWND